MAILQNPFTCLQILFFSSAYFVYHMRDMLQLSSEILTKRHLDPQKGKFAKCCQSSLNRHF